MTKTKLLELVLAAENLLVFKKAKHENCKSCKKTKIVTCTPTTTETIRPPILTPKKKCCNEGGAGQNNIFNRASSNITTVDCCKYCFDNPSCYFWRMAFTPFYECALFTWNQVCTNFTLNTIPSWKVGMIGCDKFRVRAVPE
ncbi:hypothetical protein Glove_357g31 [Diversispora epigaea]|uniref:Uncharacterized protein n=1 Tax=Diversispora epigaea TaxID=1348612 RepID=A0A397HBN6_9GLOM|nr:hypothetical protein Glove_357g31 [Diversispora epigaea]